MSRPALASSRSPGYVAFMPNRMYFFTVFATLACVSSSRADWPEFRGPFGNGYVSAPDGKKAVGLPLNWSETENVRWKTPIPDRGWSTPVVMNGQCWLTTATEDGHDFFAICVDANTGKILHNQHLFHCDAPEPLGNAVNGYASPSPAIEPGRVYVHFGSYGTACLDTATGKVIWQRDDLPCRHYRGPSSSVVLGENLVILTLDGVDQQYIVALDKQTGDNVWTTKRDVVWHDQEITASNAEVAQRIHDGDMRKAHSTPLIVRLPDGRPLMLSGGAMAAFAYDPRTGKEQWRIEFDDFSVIPRPIYKDGVAYMVTGNIHTELWAIRASATGNLTDTDNVLWRLKSRVAHTASPILVDGLIYMATDDGVINCIDAATGAPAWQKRIGGVFTASPIYGDGRLYFCDRDGQTTIIKPGRKFEKLASNTLDDGCMASPAVDGRALVLRTRTNLYRIETSAPAGE
jgi:outer membrane protein assembly factor BamB